MKYVQLRKSVSQRKREKNCILLLFMKFGMAVCINRKSTGTSRDELHFFLSLFNFACVYVCCVLWFWCCSSKQTSDFVHTQAYKND